MLGEGNGSICEDEEAEEDSLPEVITIGVRSALTGEPAEAVHLKPEDTIACLRQAIADANGETCSLWLLYQGRLLPDRETLEEATLVHESIVDFIRCQPVPSIAPPPTAPANFEITVRYALSGASMGKIELWPTDSLASLRQSIVKSQAWDGPIQLVHEGGQPLVGPLNLIEAGLYDGVTVDAVRCEPRILVAACADGMVRLVNVQSRAVVCDIKHKEWVNSAVTSPDGRYLLATLFDNTAKLWRLDGLCCIATLARHRGPVLWGNFSPNSHLVGTASYDHTAKIWSTDTGNVVADLVGHTDGILCIVFSPSGLAVATASYDRSVKLWNIANGECTKTFDGHSDEVRSVAFSPDGNTLATASADLHLKLWDIAGGVCLRTCAGHRAALSSVAFSPCGRFLATAAADRTARLWDGRSGETLMELSGHEDVVTCASFSMDGQVIATASADNTSRVWATESGECLACIRHNDVVTSVSFSTKSSGQEVAGM